MRARRVDDNQSDIIKALRAIGCTVADTSGAGNGFPDIVAGRFGINYMIEIKDGKKSKSRRSLTRAQELFHETWRGQIVVVESIEEAIQVVT